MAYDADALATLTDEERAAIEGDKPSTEELEALQDLAGTDGEEEGQDHEDETDEVVDADGNPVTTEADPVPAESAQDNSSDGATDPAPAAPVAANPVETFQPRYTAQLPANYAEQLTGIATERAELLQAFKDGDIDVDDYNAKLEELSDKRDSLNAARVKAEIASEMNNQAAQQGWHNTVRTFVATVAANEPIDYLADEGKRADLDSFVQVLARNAAHADKPPVWFLQEAHRMVKTMHGIGNTKPAVEQRDPKAELAKAKAERKPDLSAAPKTLAQVPGGDGPGDVTDEFADIDRLDGLEYEAALARMPADKRERYASGR